MDFKTYLSKNKEHLYKNLLKLEDIQPNQRIKLVNVIEMATKDKKTGARWESEVTLNSARHYWRISASLFNQIAEYCNTNGTDEFYITSISKERIGKVKCWILKLEGQYIGPI